MKTKTNTPLLRPKYWMNSNKSKTTRLLAGAALASALLGQPAFAAVTTQGWWHLGEGTTVLTDASGNSRNFLSAYSTAPASGGNFGALLTQNGVGGPLDGTGFTSVQCIRLGVGVGGKRQSAMWGTGYNPPPTNFGIEIWASPQDYLETGRIGIAGGSGGWLLSSGQFGGVAIRVVDNGDGTSSIEGGVINGNYNNMIKIGDAALADTNKWTHFAIVNENGTNTFYVNGVASGAASDTNTASAGDMYCGTPDDNQAFDGFLDEARVFTFAPGQFSTNDLLLRPVGPLIVNQPQSATVWDGGAVPFSVTASLNNNLTYQWRRGGANVAGETASTIFLPLVTGADNGNTFDCVVSDGSLSVTSSPATLSIATPNATDVAFYRSAVNAEASLLAYFPADNNTGLTLSNSKDPSRNGTLELNATYDGRTNRAFGQRAVAFNANGGVQIPANPAYEFAGGNGTIEALVYLASSTLTDQTIFALATDGGEDLYYALRISRDGGSLVYSNDATGQLSWTLPGNRVGKWAHVALVINNLTNVTPYLDGQSLGSKAQVGFGATPGAPAWIGSLGTSVADFRLAGTVDELAVYGSALSQATIQTHYSRFFYGTNIVGPSVVSQSTSRTIFTGGSPTMSVTASGTPPLSFQWKSNNVAIPGATGQTLKLANVTTNFAATYTVAVGNVVATNDSAPIVLTIVAPTSPLAMAIMPDSPVSYWRLLETSGTTAADSAGFNDTTFTGTVNLGAPPVPSANTDPAVNFAATGSADGPNVANLNPDGPFTLEVWTRPDAGAAGCIVGSQYRVSSRGGYALYGNFFGVPQYFIDIGIPGATVSRFISGTIPQAGVPVHLVFTFDGTNGALYVNGLVESSGTIAVFERNPVAPFTIAKRSDGAAAWNGAVDEVAFYNSALSAARVKQHTLAGMPLMVAIGKASDVVVDSKPAGTPHQGVNDGATWTAANGSRTGVMQFVGTNTTQITLANNPDFQSTVGTICFWMRSPGASDPAAGTGSEGAMLFDWRGAAGAVIVLADDGTLFFQTTPGSANSFHSIGLLDNNAWHHVAVTYDQQVNGLAEVYIDGILDNQSAGTAAWAWEARTIELGRSHDGYWKKFNGYLDDFRMYNRVLNATEVSSIASSAAVVDSAALKVRFNFDAAPATGLSISWSPGWATLQSASNVTGPYLDIPNAFSPYVAIPVPGAQFFRAVTP
jgi:hypothetical protein